MQGPLVFLFTVFLAFCAQSQHWEELAPVPADGRDDAVAFSIAGKGFLVTGNQSGFSESNRLWMFDPSSAAWTEKASFPGTARQYAGVFSIGDVAYVVAGISAGSVALKDAWKYDFKSDTWTQLADFPGEARWSVFNFELFGKGYIGTGTTGANLLSDAWSYDPSTGSWEPIAGFPASARRETVGFSCLGKGYVGLGYLNIDGTGLRSDFYSYNPLTNQWDRIADYPADPCSYAIATGTGSRGIVGSGFTATGNFSNAFYAYDPLSDNWEALAAFPAAIRGMSAFTIDQTPFFLTGLTGSLERTSRMWKFTTGESPSTPFAVYPNPGGGRHVIRADSGTSYAIYDSASRKIKSGMIGPENVVLLEDLRPGWYSIVLTNEKSELISNQKLVVR